MPCSKTLYFHIGSHKTATTLLQNSLAANAAELARAGLLYPRAGRQHHGHHPLALQLRDPDLAGQPLDSRGDWPALLREIDSSEAPSVLLSSENFEWAQDLTPLQALLPRYRMRVIYYMRSPESYLQSFYNQLVKDTKTRETRTLETYICEHGLFFLDNEKLLNRWAEALGQAAITVRLYQAQRRPAQLLPRFLETLGCHSPLPLVPPRGGMQKVSLPPDALEYLRLRNLYQAPERDQNRLTLALAEIARSCAPELQRTRAGLLSLATQRNLLRRFGPGNLRVARRYLGSSLAPFALDRARAHPGFDQRLAVGDDLMIARVETLLSRHRASPPVAPGAPRAQPRERDLSACMF